MTDIATMQPTIDRAATILDEFAVEQLTLGESLPVVAFLLAHILTQVGETRQRGAAAGHFQDLTTAFIGFITALEKEALNGRPN